MSDVVAAGARTEVLGSAVPATAEGRCVMLNVGIRINREAVKRNEVIEFLDVVVLSVRQNVSGSIAKLVIETLGDEVELECFVELFGDYLFEDVSVQWQWLDRTVNALIIRTKWIRDPYVYTGFIVPDDTKESKQR